MTSIRNGGKSNNSSMIPTYGAHIPEDKDQMIVMTPYGEGLIIRTSRNKLDGEIQIQEIVLTGWNTSTVQSESPNKSSIKSSTEIVETPTAVPNRPATLFSPIAFPSTAVTEGCDVRCIYGRGRVIEIRSTDSDKCNDVVVIQLSSWRLANRSRVICYLNAQSVHVLRSKHVYEMSVVERIERAMELKQQAAYFFSNKDYQRAWEIYGRAIDVVQYVQHSTQSTNAVRADLLVVMITCSNNAATCSLKLDRLEEASKHAQQALGLLDALEKKKGLKIHGELLSQGHSDIRLFGEWKVKSLLIIARSLAENDEIEAAMDTAKTARDIITSFTAANAFKLNVENGQVPMDTTIATNQHTSTYSYQQSVKQLQNNDKELLKLFLRCKERRKAQLKKERLRAQAMFATPSTDAKVETSQGSVRPNAAAVSTPDSHIESTQNASTTTTNHDDTNGSKQPNKKGARSVTFSEVVDNVEYHREDVHEDNDDIAWHRDPFFLGGLGVLVGGFGTLILLSQWARRK